MFVTEKNKLKLYAIKRRLNNSFALIGMLACCSLLLIQLRISITSNDGNQPQSLVDGIAQLAQPFVEMAPELLVNLINLAVL